MIVSNVYTTVGYFLQERLYGSGWGIEPAKSVRGRSVREVLYSPHWRQSTPRAELRPSNMPKAKTPKKATLSKSDFIRQQPSYLSAAELVSKAKAAGINFTPVLVYKVRGRAKAKRSAAKKASAIVTTAPNAAATKPAKSKSAFIRSLPSSTPAKEVVKQAKALGMKLTESYVYNVRGAAKKTAKAKRADAKSPAVRVANGGASRGSTSAENLLKAVAAEIGLGPAIEILAGERARVAAVIGG
jgi:hypothetical protein